MNTFQERHGGCFFRLYRAIEQDSTFSTKIGLKTIVYPDSV